MRRILPATVLGRVGRTCSFVFLLALLLAPETSWAATVAKVGKTKEQEPYVAIDAGSKKGFVMGAEACVVDDSGEELACGSIVNVRDHAAAMILAPDKAAKVEVGMEVRLKGADSVVEVEPEETPPVTQELPKPIGPARIDIGYVYGLRLPVTFQTVGFAVSSRTTGTGSPWTSHAERATSPVGFLLDYVRPLSERGALGAGFTYQYVPKSTVDLDYDATEPGNYVEGSSLAHHYAVSVAGLWSVMRSSSLDVNVGSGLGLHRSVVTIALETTGGKEAARKLASLQSSLNLLTLDLTSDVAWRFAGWRLGAGLGLAVPVASFGPGQKGSVDLPDDAGNTDRGVDGAVKALKHQKSSFGASLNLTLGREL